LTSTVHCPLIGIPSASYEPPSTPGWPLYRYNGSYTHALAAAGGAPIAIPLDLPTAALRVIFDQLDGLCLAGGDDVDPACFGEAPHPQLGRIDAARDTTELLTTRWALDAGLPILGICRGIQVLNVAAGGTLHQDIRAQAPTANQHSYRLEDSPWDHPTQTVTLTEGSRLAQIFAARTLRTNSFHHQAVRDAAPGFAVTGYATDGIIEGIEAVAHPFAVGVQWHPEGMYETDAASRRLFAAFIEACGG
jgi:putative glutamine amidotransferase